MRNKLGIVCMIVGAVLIGSALLLLVHNRNEDRSAEKAVNNVLPNLQLVIEERQSEMPESENPTETEEPTEMAEAEVNGYDYIGYISIPALKIELPVMADCDYARLKIAPCRQFGSVKDNDLVIAGHNYNSHFGRLNKLAVGDSVTFTDLDGETFIYSVEAIETLDPSQTDEVRYSDWDLTLYTCTYDGKERVTIRCSKTQT